MKYSIGNIDNINPIKLDKKYWEYIREEVQHNSKLIKKRFECNVKLF